MPKHTLSLGFIGGGLSSAVGQVHYNASRLDGRWDVVAGAFSRNPDTNSETAAQWNIAADRTYSSWQEMIEQEQGHVDAIAVLLPTPEHAKVVAALLDKKIPVICEKSLAISLDEMTALAHQFDADNNYLAVTYNYSGYPLVRELRQLIQSGELGTIQQLHFEMPQEGFVRPPMIAGKPARPQEWRLHDPFIPMVSFDLGMHLHHLAYFLTGEEAEQVMCDYSTYTPFREITDTASLWLKYASGMKGTFWYSKAAIGHRNGLKLRIFGDKASAEWLQLHPEELKVSYLDGSIKIIDRGADPTVCSAARYNRMKPGHPSGFIEAFANLYNDIADHLGAFQANRGLSSPYVYGLEHAHNGIKFFHAASHSNQSENWVDTEV